MRIFQHRLLFHPESDSGLPGSTETEFSATAADGATEPTTTAPETGAGATATEKTSDDTSRPNHAPKAGIAKRIRARISGVFAKAGFSKGKGRPKKCRACGGEKCSECGFTGFEPGKGDTPGDGEPNPGAEAGEPGDVEKTTDLENPAAADPDNREIIDAALESGTAVALDALDTVILFSADITGHDPDFSERAVSNCRTKADKNIERFAQALKLWFKEDNIVIEKPGKKTAILCGAQMLLPYTNLLRHFRSEAARKARSQLKK